MAYLRLGLLGLGVHTVTQNAQLKRASYECASYDNLVEQLEFGTMLVDSAIRDWIHR